MDQLVKDKMMRFTAFCTFRYKAKSAISMLRCVLLRQHAEIQVSINFLSGCVLCLSSHVDGLCYWSSKMRFLYRCSAHFVLPKTTQRENKGHCQVILEAEKLTHPEQSNILNLSGAFEYPVQINTDAVGLRTAENLQLLQLWCHTNTSSISRSTCYDKPKSK